MTPWTAALQAFLSLTISQNLPKFTSIELMMLSNCLILCSSFCLQSFPVSGSFAKSQLFASGGQSIRTSISPSNKDLGFIFLHSFKTWFLLSTQIDRMKNAKKHITAGSIFTLGFPSGSDGTESACNVVDLGPIPELGRSPGGGHGNPLQCSCLENPHGQRSLAGCSPGSQRLRHDWVAKHSSAHCSYLYIVYSFSSYNDLHFPTG